MSTSGVVGAADAEAVVEFWRAAGPQRWFGKDEAFDARFRESFLNLHERATRGELESWLGSAVSSLALVLLLDQFPRNAFRGSPRMYATDELARQYAERAISLGHDHAVEAELQFFFYLPFSHAESLAEQERSVAWCQRFGPEILKHITGHRDIVRRFGRFPHRNAILGRPSTDEEREFLAAGGFAG